MRDEDMLQDLTLIPVDLDERRTLLRASTCLLVHEIGHIIAEVLAIAAPTDYLIADGMHNAIHSGTYTHLRYRPLFERDEAARGRILAAGFAAEELMFGEANLGRADADLRSLASMLKVPWFSESQRPTIARLAHRRYDPIFPMDVKDIIASMYRNVVRALQSGRFELDNANMVPFYVFHDRRLPIPAGRRLAAMVRTRLGLGRRAILATLRGQVSSGLR